MNFLGKVKRIPFANFTYITITHSLSVILLNGFIPFLVFFTERGVPNKAVACTKFFSIRVLPKFSSDLSVITHEAMHLRQTVRTFGFHFVLYNFCIAYRYESELEAYAEQCMFLIINSDIGVNNILIDELICWVTEVLEKNMNFSILLLKEKDVIQKDVTVALISSLKKYRTFIVTDEDEDEYE